MVDAELPPLQLWASSSTGSQRCFLANFSIGILAAATAVLTRFFSSCGQQ